jgi:hypothetical protein
MSQPRVMVMVIIKDFIFRSREDLYCGLLGYNRLLSYETVLPNGLAWRL